MRFFIKMMIFLEIFIIFLSFYYLKMPCFLEIFDNWLWSLEKQRKLRNSLYFCAYRLYTFLIHFYSFLILLFDVCTCLCCRRRPCCPCPYKCTWSMSWLGHHIIHRTCTISDTDNMDDDDMYGNHVIISRSQTSYLRLQDLLYRLIIIER